MTQTKPNRWNNMKKTALFDGFEWCFPLNTSSALNCFLQFRWLENRNMVSSEYSSALVWKSNLDFSIFFTHHFTYDQIIRAEQSERLTPIPPVELFTGPARGRSPGGCSCRLTDGISRRLLPVKTVSSKRWNWIAFPTVVTKTWHTHTHTLSSLDLSWLSENKEH